MKMLYALLIVAVVILSACSSDTTYTPPVKIESSSEQSTPTSSPIQEVKPETTPEVKPEAVSQPDQPKITVFKVGETASDGELKVTVNAVRFVNSFRGESEYSVAKASAGKEYAILDLTIENILADETQSWHPWNTEIIDQDGYTYEESFDSYNLPKYLPAGEILPSMKKRGEVAYEVSATASDLNFIYKFDTFEGTSAVFDIK